MSNFICCLILRISSIGKDYLIDRESISCELVFEEPKELIIDIKIYSWKSGISKNIF